MNRKDTEADSDMAAKRKERRQLKAERKRVRTEVQSIRRELERCYCRFDEICDPMQLDACILEMNALRAKYCCAMHDLRALAQPQS